MCVAIRHTRGNALHFNFQVNFSDAKIDLEIEVKSIATRMPDRDTHLLSADFLDAEKFPHITFRSTSFKKINEEEFELKGDLTIRSVSKPFTFKVTYGGQVVDPWGNLRAGFHIEGSRNRF